MNSLNLPLKMNACFLPKLDRRENLTVVVGAHDCIHGSHHMDVKFYHIYPGYESESLLNDIMLLQVNDSARFCESIFFSQK